MSRVPGFLRKSARISHAPDLLKIRCGSFALVAQGASNWRYALHHDRPDNFLLWITRGQGRAIVNGVRCGLSTNSALYLPAGTLMALDLPVGTQALYVESPGGLTGKLPREPHLLRVRDSLGQAELTGHIDAMVREINQQRPYTAEALEAQIRLIAVWLRRQLADGAADPPSDTAGLRLVRRFAQTVTRDHRSAQLINDYAALLDVTPTHLSRACKAACGLTAAEILTQRKLHAVRTALEQPSPSVQEISRQLGFASPAYFSRFVQTRTGQTPTALRAAAKARREAG